MEKVNVIFSNSLADIVPQLKEYSAVFVIADKKVRNLVTEPLVDICAEAGVAIRGLLNIRALEWRKNMKTIYRIHRWLIGAGADRNSLLLAIGGGITTDLVGFAAATYMRGVRYVNVPTTLLAQVDAAIGGKTGCNINRLKNMAGAFHMPQFTFVCPDFVKTLPWKEFVAGYAEMIKTFIIADSQAYEQAVNKDRYDDIGPLIHRAVELKAQIVEADFTDKGHRRLLNLGHTFAHAIEARSRCGRLRRFFKSEGIPHGQAVAMGIILSARKAEMDGVAQKGLEAKLKADFMALGLPVECPWPVEELIPYMAVDKKNLNGRRNFVLPRRIGDCIVVEEEK